MCTYSLWSLETPMNHDVETDVKLLLSRYLERDSKSVSSFKEQQQCTCYFSLKCQHNVMKRGDENMGNQQQADMSLFKT